MGLYLYMILQLRVVLYAFLCVQQNFVFSITTSPEGKTITSARILVQVTIYRGLLTGQDCHLDQSESYDIS